MLNSLEVSVHYLNVEFLHISSFASLHVHWIELDSMLSSSEHQANCIGCEEKDNKTSETKSSNRQQHFKSKGTQESDYRD